MRIIIARTVHELGQLRPAWEDLYRSGGPTLFQSYRWNEAAARIFAGRESLRVVYAESAGGAALIPACVRAEGLALLGDELFDYRDFLATGDTDALREAWRVLAPQAAPLRVTALCGESGRARWSEMGFSPRPFAGAPCVREICASEFARRHHRSARFLRRLSHAGCVTGEYSGRNSALVRRLYELKAAQAEIATNLFADPLRRAFMVAAAAGDPGCEIFTVESGATLVAALLTFRDDRVRRFYTTYYDPAWARESPGSALLLEVTRRSLEQGLDCDYMTGEHPHKTRFANGSVPLFQVEASREQLRSLAAAASPQAA